MANITNVCLYCPPGSKGDTGVCVTNNYAYAANTTGASITLSLISPTYNIRLPSKELSSYITANGNNDEFTISNAGTYYIKYQIYTTSSLLLNTRLIINGSGNTASTVSPVVSLSSFSSEVIVDLTENSTVSLQIFGLLGVVVIPSGSCGASLTIIRLA
ncbi:BclA C-terminal domain-containing protein [Terrisporobacter petrolearius]|uniref:BclA C-terminal domain-containing protein n=1 Tax=Terrisporobacter petrolearius TaxID=1460447 RepID=UPI0031CC6FD5